MQKDRRKKRKEGVDMETIGYVIYLLKGGEPEGPQEIAFFKRSASVAKSPSFVNMREITGRHKLTPGQYLIVPSTFEPQKEAQFLLRIYSEKPQLASYVYEASCSTTSYTGPLGNNHSSTFIWNI